MLIKVCMDTIHFKDRIHKYKYFILPYLIQGVPGGMCQT